MLFKGQFETDEDDKDGGTLTGRTSAKDPAMQTLPKHHKHKNAINWAKKLRSCYIAPVEYVFWECDFSQGELRITACIAGEEVMLNAYAQGLDLHAVTGAKLAGYELGEFMALKEFAEGTPERELFESKRQGAKAGNFGLLYGMGPSGFREYARIAYGVVMTMEEAENAHKAFFDLYPRLLTWHAKSIQHARQHLMVRSPLGRIRHLPLIRSNDSATRSYAERQAINSPVQGTLSDLCLWAIAEIEREMGQTEEVQVIGMTHDAAYGYVRADKAPELMYRVKTIMSTLPIKETFGWDHQIPFPVDVAVSQPGENNNWANLQKIKLAA
jgi:DNA polymerase I-like protein with 3'-5' exonuclease and polymerase domains